MATAHDDWQNEVNSVFPFVATMQNSQSASHNEVIPEELMHVAVTATDAANTLATQTE